MVGRLQVIEMDPYGEVRELLSAVHEEPLVLKIDGVRSVVLREQGSEHTEDRHAAIEKAFGGWANFDYKAF